ncbi:MAG TPA: ABC transporter permease [Thermomicrobiales bacterium]|nr:ABC transporter permease [Thermomicrobiales bacterium]
MTEQMPPARYGEIYDRGYQHYLGERLGQWHAIWALVLYSIKRAMGIKKSWTAKVIPIILYLAVVGTVLIVIGIEAFAGSATGQVMTYPDYFGFIYLIQGAFVATIAPEMLCGDRRENVLSLYFSRAITRWDYIFAKLLATAILTMTISTVPAIFLWFFRQLLADHPLSALRTNADELGKIIVIGTLIAGLLGCGGLVISSFTGRKSIATAVIFVGYAILEGLNGALLVAIDSDRARDAIALFSPFRLINEMSSKMFGLYDASVQDHPGYGWPVYMVACVGWVVIGIIVMAWRYVPED